MKRTALLRKAPLKPQKKPLQRSPMSRGLTGKLFWQSHQRVKQRTQSKKPRRKKPLSVETAHFKRVAMLPCACCGVVGFSQAAYSNRYQDGKGARIKAHYLATFPLCCSRPGIRGCHVEHDQCIGITREEADARTAVYIADTHRRLGIHQ
ncbi:hypothetical protein KTQ42_17215|uniref:hypothetical protein n=1 Tax=Noviherbaspirillum sp. L7-7A TaxID=2850560 RepID=UPI001C2BF453|nr:hypothetical protein [Noviherbaspirillum sp. L7-7A]MBV0881039.1 hypothetical protein [Noviherbaspirillum sp. L7-7A]